MTIEHCQRHAVTTINAYREITTHYLVFSLIFRGFLHQETAYKPQRHALMHSKHANSLLPCPQAPCMMFSA